MGTAPITGNMRYDIEIQSKTLVRDDYGAETIAYTKFLNLKSEVKYLSGVKGISADEIFTSVKIQFLTYYREGIKPDMIIIFKNQRYSINAIEEVGFRTSLTITCELIND